MGVRKSDLMAVTAILVGAGAGFGLTNLYAHGQRNAVQDELITIMESDAPHYVTTMRVRGSDHDHARVQVMEIRREARSKAREARGQAREARERAREIRTEVRVGKAFALQEALEGLEGLKSLESLESLESLGSLEILESLDGEVMNLEALEEAMEELQLELQAEFDGEAFSGEAFSGEAFSGDVTIDIQVDDADDQHKKKKRKRRVVVKRPGNDGPGN